MVWEVSEFALSACWRKLRSPQCRESKAPVLGHNVSNKQNTEGLKERVGQKLVKTCHLRCWGVEMATFSWLCLACTATKRKTVLVWLKATIVLSEEAAVLSS